MTDPVCIPYTADSLREIKPNQFEYRNLTGAAAISSDPQIAEIAVEDIQARITYAPSERNFQIELKNAAGMPLIKTDVTGQTLRYEEVIPALIKVANWRAHEMAVAKVASLKKDSRTLAG